MTKIAKNLLITAATTGTVAGSGAVTIYYVVNDNDVKEDVESKVNINTIITDDQISFYGKRFETPTKDEITSKLIELYGDNGLTLEDFEITSRIDPIAKPGFKIDITAIGENYTGTKSITVEFNHVNEIFLKDIVTPGFKFLNKKYDIMPEPELVLKDLQKQFPLLDINKVKANSIVRDDVDEYGFTISPKDDGTVGKYKGEVDVFITLKKQISLVPREVFIQGGLNQTSKPDINTVKKEIIKKTWLVDLKSTDFDIKEVPQKSRTWTNGDNYFVEVTGKGDNFTGTAQVEVKWNWLEFKQLSDVVEVKNISEKFNSMPNNDEILSKIIEQNPNLETKYIKPITVDAARRIAIITADEKDEFPYKGSVAITFGVKRDIKDVFDKQKEIEFGNVSEKPTDEKIGQKLLEIDPGFTAENYTMEFLETKTWAKNEFKVKVIAHPTSNNFIGETTLTVKYNLDNKKDLKNDLTVTNLKINFANKPTEWEITDELVKQNPNLIKSGISVSSINESSGIVAPKKGDDLPYSGENIKINFNIQQNLDEVFKEADRFAGFFGEGNLDDTDTKTALDAVDNFVKSKVGEDEFKFIKCEIESTGTVRYFVEDKTSSIYKGSVKITWKFNRKMQNVVNDIPAFKGETIGYRPTANDAWDYVSAELNKTELVGKWNMVWEDNGENKSLIKISPQSMNQGLLGYALIGWNAQTELSALFVDGKNSIGYFGNGSKDESSKQMAYDAADKHVSNIVGADQFKHLKREMPTDGKIKYTAQNTPETQFKNSVTIDWKFNVKTQDYINSLSGFNDGNIGWFESQTDAWNHTVNNLDKSELSNNYTINLKDDNLLIKLKKQNTGFVGDALIAWSKKINVQSFLEEMKINTLGWMPDNDTARNEAIKKLDETFLKGKYNITTNSYNHFVITPKSNEFFGTGVVTWSRAKTVQSVITSSKLSTLGWVADEKQAQEIAIKKLDETDLKGKYNIELDARNDIIVSSKVSEYAGTAKITWKRARHIGEIIKKYGLNDIGYAKTRDEAFNIAKQKLDKTELKSNYDIYVYSDDQFVIESRADELYGEGYITWNESTNIQDVIDKAWNIDDNSFNNPDEALKAVKDVLNTTELFAYYTAKVGYDDVIYITPTNDKYSGVGEIRWNRKLDIGKEISKTNIQLSGWYKGDRKGYGSEELEKELHTVLDPTLKGEYEIRYIQPSDTSKPKNVGELRDIQISAISTSKKYFGSFSYKWNAKVNLFNYIHDNELLEDLGTIWGDESRAKVEAMAIITKELDKNPLFKGRYILKPNRKNDQYRIAIGIKPEFEDYFDGTITYSVYTPRF